MNRLFVDDLTVLDFSYLHPGRGIVGESWIVDIELAGELDAQGMVFDFGHVKKLLKQSIESTIDHKLVIPEQLQYLDVEHYDEGETARTDVSATLADGSLVRLSCPAEAIVILPLADIQIDTVVPLLKQQLQAALPPNVKELSLYLREEVIQGPYYHYTHGLKKHEGDCQRIAHGHRSRIEIYSDGRRSQLTEYQWAKRWKDIYLGHSEDVVSEEVHNGRKHIVFEYESSQGRFRLVIGEHSVYMLETETTVECIAEHIAARLKRQNPQNRFRVKAFEGVRKGAIAER
ncbi:6-carboxytetrahydropterin synthase [Allohahella sp. A8]|uniref:6-carboxytetrahydropterin synthase n=1 Tax=Allohahella sp. A8 TaxID=3141461 RepID=UPI000C09E31C|nr:6-pyruvoyl tetrahydropterin reductase [Hahellaceae bacterium]|tara:strand:+ start:27459 stop:28322 length:864 start_codon:yes stop_codon:yes gene_type:complete